jgi:hypothetical protein
LLTEIVDTTVLVKEGTVYKVVKLDAAPAAVVAAGTA